MPNAGNQSLCLETEVRASGLIGGNLKIVEIKHRRT